MTNQQKKIILETAKQAIKAAVAGKRAAKPICSDEQLKQKQGCFVTIKNSDELRGCIGNFTADKPLIEMVSDMAVSAAKYDPRFVGNRITEDELDELDIEISVLSPLKRTNDPLSLRLGIDGIYISRGHSSGCFLPQVATETGWSKEEFLSCCCSHKAGLKPDAWKDPATEVFLFSCDVWGAKFCEI